MNGRKVDEIIAPTHPKETQEDDTMTETEKDIDRRATTEAAVLPRIMEDHQVARLY